MVYIHTLNPIKAFVQHNFSEKRMDAFLSALTVKEFSQDGSLLHHLEASMMQHIPEKNTYVFKNPHLIITEANQAPWEIRAHKARSEADKSITLTQQVVIQQKAYQQKQAITVTTEAITYFPQSKLARTAEPVTIKQANNQIKAIGMDAYLADNKIALLGDVRGRYEPNKTDSKT
jgi:lipopolysaccharide export system protein LptC